MFKRIVSLFVVLALICSVFTACKAEDKKDEVQETEATETEKAVKYKKITNDYELYLTSKPENGEKSLVERYNSGEISAEIENINKAFKEMCPNFNGDAIVAVEPTGSVRNEYNKNYSVCHGEINAESVRSFILTDKSAVAKKSANMIDMPSGDEMYTPYVGDGKYVLTNEASYRVVTEASYNDFAEYINLYKVKGDPSKVLDGKHCVVGEVISDKKIFDFKVGDKISVARFQSYIAEVDSTLKGKNLLKRQIKNYSYSYYDLSVCAVIENMPADNLPVYISENAFNQATNCAAEINVLKVYLNEKLDDDQRSYISEKINEVVPLENSIYHMEIYGLNVSQFTYLKHYKHENGAFDKQKELYVITDYIEYTTDEETLYDIKIRFGKIQNINDYINIVQYYNDFNDNCVSRIAVLDDEDFDYNKIVIGDRLEYALNEAK